MISHLPLSMSEALRIYLWKCGCSQQGAQEGGEEQESESCAADQRCVQAVGQATGISEAYVIFVRYTHQKE